MSIGFKVHGAFYHLKHVSFFKSYIIRKINKLYVHYTLHRGKKGENGRNFSIKFLTFKKGSDEAKGALIKQLKAFLRDVRQPKVTILKTLAQPNLYF